MGRLLLLLLRALSRSPTVNLVVHQVRSDLIVLIAELRARGQNPLFELLRVDGE